MFILLARRCTTPLVSQLPSQVTLLHAKTQHTFALTTHPACLHKSHCYWKHIRAMASKKGEYTYEYPRPAFTVDVAVVTSTSPPKLLLIQRKHDPYAGFWALPGGFVDEMEPLDVAAARELQEETSIDPSLVATMRQVGTFGDPGRDPRGWTVTTAYGVIVPSTEMGVQAADDAAEAHWFEVSALPKMAFDHKLVVKTALEELAKEAVAGDGDGALRAALTEAAEKLKASWKE